MKRVVQHPEPSELSGPRYWRSLGELAESPGFKAQLEREFPEGASSIDGVDRRYFLKIMAASFALGGLGLSGCRRPELHILPFGKSVEDAIPGLPLYYATAMPLRRYALPLLAETHQGRPTKIEGNPTYATYGGASTLMAQASLLELYDPDRATAHLKDGAKIETPDATDIVDALGQAYAATQGAGLAILADSSSSPTRARLVAGLRKRLPKAIWAEYEPVRDEPPVEAALACFGRSVKPLYRFAKARRIVSLDADFLGAEADNLAHTRDFSQGRRVLKPTDEMNRLYVAESGFSLTGAMADHRLRLASSHMLALAAALAVEVTGNQDFEPLTRGLDVTPEWIKACAADLLEHRGESLVLAGSHHTAQVHAIAYAINVFLGNVQRTIDFALIEVPVAASIQDLAKAIQSGGVKTLVVLNGNPAYNAPVELGFAELLKKVPQVVRYGYYVDETSAHAQVHLAATHYLESWGDARTIDGTVLPIQPMIMPLFNGLTEVEVLARLSGESVIDPYTQVFNTVTPLIGGDPQRAIEKFLHDGLAEGTGYSLVDVRLDPVSMAKLYRSAAHFEALSESNLEVRFVADYKVDDGRFANNGWLQECPDPMSRLTWDNAFLISPKLAKALGVYPKAAPVQVARLEAQNEVQGKESAPIAELTLGGRTVRGPIHILPGLSDYTVVVPLGYGRTHSGHVGNGAGFNGYAVRTAEGASYAMGGSLKPTGEHVLLADTQMHWSMEGRGIVREANYQEYREHPDFVKDIGMQAETPPVYGRDGDKLTLAQKSSEIPRGNSLYKTPAFDGFEQWGMSIDLNICTGCNACVVACQSENNIPIVGRQQVIRGREMHWIRIDRYFSDGKADPSAFGGAGNRELPEDPQVSLQPVACSQCELAPCEMVCPVAATVHDSEGLNVMAYNRCIGTRYCANNCPYKVRRFNFFDWNQRELDDLYLGPLGPEGMPELVKMAKNPEVTVRMRGVMEKCTYCVQRIENGKIQWKAKMAQAGHPGDVVPPDGTIRTACQQACPAGAIEFGNILNPESEVSKAKAREQDYALLGYLNTRPRTTYLGKLRNPNPKMPDYHSLPLSRIEYENKSGESSLKDEVHKA